MTTVERVFGPCQKCGGTSDILIHFHDGEPHCSYCGEAESCRFSGCGISGPHLRIVCRRCQWAWCEDTEDALEADR